MLTVPQQFDLDQLCEWTAARRGRPLYLRAMPDTEAAPTGVWIATDVEDLVLVETHTSALHRRHIAFHEIGHMLWEHGGAVGTLGGRRLLSHLTSPVVGHILARGLVTDRQEREAEMLALLLSSRAGGPAFVAPREPSRPASGVAGGAGQGRGLAGGLITRGRDIVGEVMTTVRVLHRLRRLWGDLRSADRSIRIVRPGWTAMATPAGWRLLLLRRVVEIRDAQLALRSYADLDVDGSSAAVTEARLLVRACQAKLRGADPTVPCTPLTVAGGHRLSDEVAALLALAAAWDEVSARTSERDLRSARRGGRR